MSKFATPFSAETINTAGTGLILLVLELFGVRQEASDPPQVPDEEPAEACAQYAALEVSRLDSLRAFKPLNCLPLEEAEPVAPVSLECAATLLRLQFQDARLEEAFLVRVAAMAWGFQIRCGNRCAAECLETRTSPRRR